MIGADAAFAALMNRAAAAYLAAPPAYMTYRETTHVEGANRSEDVNRYVAVRVADDFAVMQDLPNGATRTGTAFPVIPYFDPFSSFQFSYFANLKRLDITFDPGKPFQIPPPPDDTSVNVVLPYFSEYAPRFAPDSTDTAVHLVIDPTPRTGDNVLYPSEIVEDPQTHLPKHVTMQDNGSDMTIGMDFGIVDGYWVLTRGTFSQTQHVAIIGTFKIAAVTTFTDFTFPSSAPDPRIAGTPNPSPSPSMLPAAAPSQSPLTRHRP
jgi:hypothetical protein